MIIYRCDLCGETKDCIQKEIDQREYDICSECWGALEAKLRGKGRVQKDRETVLLPSPRTAREHGKALPGEPPKIWGGVM